MLIKEGEKFVLKTPPGILMYSDKTIEYKFLTGGKFFLI